MKQKLLAVLIFSFGVLVSCDEDCDGFFHSCPDGPFFGDLNVKLTINAENPEVEVIIFRGRAEKQDTVIHDFVSQKSKIYNLEAGFYYSGNAYYQDGIKEILAINGKELSTSTDDCDCEYAENRNLNLRLAR